MARPQAQINNLNLIETFNANYQAEEFVLGAILIQSSDGSRETINEIRYLLKPEYFTDFSRYNPLHSRIYEAMLNCEGAPHIINVMRQLSKMGNLKTGDINILEHCLSLNFNSFEYLSFANAIREYAFKLKPELKRQSTLQRGVAI
jgi:replicative DNA helicase